MLIYTTSPFLFCDRAFRQVDGEAAALVAFDDRFEHVSFQRLFKDNLESLLVETSAAIAESLAETHITILNSLAHPGAVTVIIALQGWIRPGKELFRQVGNLGLVDDIPLAQPATHLRVAGASRGGLRLYSGGAGHAGFGPGYAVERGDADNGHVQSQRSAPDPALTCFGAILAHYRADPAMIRGVSQTNSEGGKIVLKDMRFSRDLPSLSSSLYHVGKLCQ